MLIHFVVMVVVSQAPMPPVLARSTGPEYRTQLDGKRHLARGEEEAIMDANRELDKLEALHRLPSSARAEAALLLVVRRIQSQRAVLGTVNVQLDQLRRTFPVMIGPEEMMRSQVVTVVDSMDICIRTMHAAREFEHRYAREVARAEVADEMRDLRARLQYSELMRQQTLDQAKKVEKLKQSA